MFDQEQFESNTAVVCERISEKSRLAFDLKDLIRDLCKRQAPLWTLERFIAVNPFQGWTDRSFLDFALQHRNDLGVDLYPDWNFFRDVHSSGSIHLQDIDRVLQNSTFAGTLSTDDLIEILHKGRVQAKAVGFQLPSEAAECPAETRSLIDESLARFSASMFDQTQAAWSFSQPQRFLEIWVAATQHDRSWDFQGLGFIRQNFSRLNTEESWNLVTDMFRSWAADAQAASACAQRLIQSISGWLAYGRFLDRENGSENCASNITEQIFLARSLTEWAVWKKLSHPQGPRSPAIWDLNEVVWKTDLMMRDLWLQAHEESLRRRLLTQLNSHTSEVKPAPRYQFVFCIDPRSEPMRRQLEAQSEEIETLGFAGFFAAPLAAVNEAGELTDRCPVLLNASIRADHQSAKPRSLRFLPLLLSRHLNTCFSYVETLGILHAPQLISRSLLTKISGPKVKPELDLRRKDQSEIPLEERVRVAQSFLKHSGLRGRLAPYVFLCGHGSVTQNNPYASALACGACGGHPGDVNAIVACQILNDKEVRVALLGTTEEIPEGTVFIPVLHETCSGQLHPLSDMESVESKERIQWQNWFQQAALSFNQERALREGRSGDPHREAQQRAADWSEVRPEWGLAGNAYFVAAPRELTRNLNLDGRAFLHNYDASSDHDGGTLELILTAPLVVAHWINMQYFASSVDPQQWGSGNKTLHNVVGSFGVLEGTSYQLRQGLPWQSIHNGFMLQHEPLRLQTLVHASCENIEAILQKHPTIRQLVEGNWITLMNIDKNGSVRKRQSDGCWQAVNAFHTS